MSERIDSLTFAEPGSASTKEPLESNLYLTGPSDYLTEVIEAQLKTSDSWSTFFGDSIDGYKRMDYSYRSLPALRIYNETVLKQNESWFMDGDVKADIIFPASIRRDDLARIPGVVSNALLQQFRRTAFFTAVSTEVPGLNELGRRFDIDKSLAFEFGDDLVPLTQLTINFRIDLRKWDDYLVENNRSKEDPFERLLGNLKTLAGDIDAYDGDDTDLTIQSTQSLEED